MAVLRAVDGVTGVNDFGTEGNHSQQFGVQLYVRERPQTGRQKVRVACAHDKPTKLEAALVARQRVAEKLGAAALEAAEERVRAELHGAGELRAVQGRQVCDFMLTPPKPPKPLRQQQARAKKQKQSGPPPFDPKMRWRLDREVDAETRRDCSAT